jgi:hypothetical protein
MKSYTEFSLAVEPSSQRRAVPIEGIVPLTVQKQATLILADITLNQLREVKDAKPGQGDSGAPEAKSLSLHSSVDSATSDGASREHPASI